MTEQVKIKNNLETEFYIRKYITPDGIEYLEASLYPDKDESFIVDYYIEGIHYFPFNITNNAIGRTVSVKAIYAQTEWLTPALVSDLPNLTEYREYRRLPTV